MFLLPPFPRRACFAFASIGGLETNLAQTIIVAHEEQYLARCARGATLVGWHIQD